MRFAERQPPGLVADQRRENVALAQRHPDANAERLLAAAEEDAAGDFAAAIKAGEFLVQRARQKHQAISLDERVGASGGFRTAPNRRLNHAG